MLLVYRCMYTYLYLCIPIYTYIYLFIPMYTYVYLCILTSTSRKAKRIKKLFSGYKLFCFNQISFIQRVSSEINQIQEIFGRLNIVH